MSTWQIHDFDEYLSKELLGAKTTTQSIEQLTLESGGTLGYVPPPPPPPCPMVPVAHMFH